MDTKTMQKAVHDEVHSVWDEMKATLAEREGEVKRLGGETAETKQKIEAIEQKLDERFERLEAARKRAEQHAQDGGLTPEAAEQRSAFLAYVRKGDRISPEQAKALATDVDADGGYLVPENLLPGIREKQVEENPLRRLATVESIGQGNDIRLVREAAAFAAAWATERAARAETTAGTFETVTLTAHEAYAKPLATQAILDDAEYDIEGYITRKTGEAIGTLERTANLTGTGTGQPRGVLTAGNGVATVASGTVGAISADDILNLIFTVPARYAEGLTLLMARDTVRRLRTLKDGQGQYIWSPGFGDQPATLFGTPYEAVEGMPTVATGARAVLAANVRELYTILDRKDISTLRDPFSYKPFVGFYTTFRVGGDVVQPDAGRILTIA